MLAIRSVLNPRTVALVAVRVVDGCLDDPVDQFGTEPLHATCRGLLQRRPRCPASVDFITSRILEADTHTPQDPIIGSVFAGIRARPWAESHTGAGHWSHKQGYRGRQMPCWRSRLVTTHSESSSTE